MIDPVNITRFDRTDEELEEFWLFSVAVAGKNATTTARAVESFLRTRFPHTPFGYVRALDDWLVERMRQARLGKYSTLARAFRESTSLDLRRATAADLEGVYGVGPKTSRFFLLHSRRGAEVAALDRHVMRWLRRQGERDVPDNTPSSMKVYWDLEARTLTHMKREFPDMTPAEADLHIWKMESGRLSA